MLTWLHNNSFILKLITLSLLCFALSEVAHADVKGIPYNERFQTAAYPYARQVTGCTDWRRPEHLGDAWSGVSFSGACQLHDRCYHTPGAAWGECNQRFLTDLHASCERDLARARLEAGRLGKPDAQALQLCFEIADLYFAKVQEAGAAHRFAFDQKQEAAYLDWVRSVVSGVYMNVLRRRATEKEKNRALATLTKDYTIDDLKTALMGRKLDLEAAAEPLPDIDTVMVDMPDTKHNN